MRVVYMSELYTCFGFSGLSQPPHLFHMTHKYLGEQPEENEKIIGVMLMKFFSEPRVVPALPFHDVDYFGSEYGRVLKLSNHDYKQFLFLDLRRRLDDWRKDDFNIWSPHITTKDKLPTWVVFDRFYLIKDRAVVLEFEV